MMNVLYNVIDLIVMIAVCAVSFVLIFVLSYMIIGAVCALMLSLAGIVCGADYWYGLITTYLH